MATNRVGQQLGNYQLIELIGEGGFAEVYLGQHRYLHSFAALKVLKQTLDEADEKQFLMEAQTLMSLRHHHIIRVLDFAVEQGTPVLIMDHAPQGTLRHRYPPGTRLPLATTVSFVLQIASALQYAHNHSVIHRDVKPGNVLLDAEGNLLMSDFGLSLFSPSSTSLSTQEPVGTFPYMAPEQLYGKPVFASDQYALAIMAYEWLCGRRPFEGNVWEIMQQHVNMPPPPLHDWNPDIPATVETVILRALAKDAQARFSSVQAFAQALARAGEEQLPEEDKSQITAPLKAVSGSSLTTSHAHFSGTAVPPQLQVSIAPVTPRKQSVSPGRSSNRHHLLTKVRTFWITGVLEHSLYGATLIALGLQKEAEAVANPWRLVLHQPDLAPQRLPAGTRILQAYDDAGGELLILGEPGSGKTTLLLELARDLLERAEMDDEHPIPVVFNLSSWATKQQPLAAWLVDELNSKYQVPRKQAQRWVEGDAILPLLDGLDEVATTARLACLKAINTYRQEHGLLPTVVCSRSAEYLTQDTRVVLSSAVIVQPLTEQQVEDYLVSGGEALWALRVALHQDAALRELTTTPLMLSILTLTYHGMPVEDLLQVASPTERQRQVFEHYIKRMLERRGGNTSTNNGSKKEKASYTPQQTVQWLSWLARQLAQHSQSVFYIERMQPDWLVESRMHGRYPGLMGGLTLGLFSAPVFGPIGGFLLAHLVSPQPPLWLILGLMLVFGLMTGSLFGLFNGLMYAQEAKRGFWSRLGRRVVQGIVNGVLIGFVLGVPYGLFLGQRAHDQQGWIILIGTAFGILGGAGFVLVDSLLGLEVTAIRPVEVFTWTWAGMARKLLQYLFFALLGSLVIGVLVGLGLSLSNLFVNKSADLLHIVEVNMIAGLQFALLGVAPLFLIISGLIGALTGGLSGERLDEHNLTVPNQGIRRSAFHSLLVGLVGALIGALVGGGLGYKVTGNWSGVLAYALIIGALIGFINALRGGGIACIQHFLLRFLLWDAAVIPWQYARFLDHATERILLRKVGGGYIFTHRLLLEYLATLEPAIGEWEQAAQVQATQAQQAAELPSYSVKAVTQAASHTPYAPQREQELPMRDLPSLSAVCMCGYHDDRVSGSFCPHCGTPKARNELLERPQLL